MRRRVPGGSRKPPPPRVRPPHRREVRRDEDRPPDAVKKPDERGAARPDFRIYDVSRRIDEKTAVWPGDVPFRWRSTARLVRGSLFESTCFTMSAHVGTHVDAPSHVAQDGAPIGRVPLNAYLGSARVVELPGRGETGPDALPRRCFGTPRLLLRTGGKTFLSPLAAIALAEKGVLLVGTDAMSVDPEDATDLPVHRTLLSRGIAVLENLDLSQVLPGDYILIALPLSFGDLDASPVRAILIKEK